MSERIYFGAWTCKEDMDLAFRGGREHFEHADSQFLIAPYPIGDFQKARVVYAASPETTKDGRPLIVLSRGGYFHVQRRMDRWSTDRIYSSSEILSLKVRFADQVASLGFSKLLGRLTRIEMESSQLVDSRCLGCGRFLLNAWVCGGCGSGPAVSA